MPQHRIPGGRTFAAAAIGQIAMGLVHGLTVLIAVFVEPQGGVEAAYREAARQYKTPIGPLEPNAWGATQILSASYAVLLVQVGVLNLLAMQPLAALGQLRLLTVLNLIFLAVQLAVAVAYQFPPPVVLGGMICALLAASLVRQGRGRSA